MTKRYIFGRRFGSGFGCIFGEEIEMTAPERWPNNMGEIRDEAALNVEAALTLVQKAIDTGKIERDTLKDIRYHLTESSRNLIYAGARVRIEKTKAQF